MKEERELGLPPMGEITRWRSNHQISLISDFDQRPVYHYPPILLLQTSNFDMCPMRRGAMFSAYAELREWKLRKKQGINAMMMPMPVKNVVAPSLVGSVHDFSMAFRKENKKPTHVPLPPTGRRFETSVTPSPPPMAMKPELKRVGSISTNGGEEKRRGRVFAMRKSYSCMKELKGINVVAASSIDKEVAIITKGSSRREVSSFQQQITTTTTWMS